MFMKNNSVLLLQGKTNFYKAWLMSSISMDFYGHPPFSFFLSLPFSFFFTSPPLFPNDGPVG